jgi:hypothetical protein
MAITTTLKNEIISYLFHGTDFSWDANTTFYISLHTASPGVGGSQTTNEATYGGYARQPVLRDATGFDISGAEASNDDLIQFPTCASGSDALTHFGIGTDVSGAGALKVFGALGSTLNVSTGIQPQFGANDIDITVVDA